MQKRGIFRFFSSRVREFPESPLTKLKKVLQIVSMMDITETEFRILEGLVVGKKYGLELVKESEGAIKRGSIYVLLGRLEDKGYVTSKHEPREDNPESKRRVYSLTGTGAAALNARNAYEAALKGGAFA